MHEVSITVSLRLIAGIFFRAVLTRVKREIRDLVNDVRYIRCIRWIVSNDYVSRLCGGKMETIFSSNALFERGLQGILYAKCHVLRYLCLKMIGRRKWNAERRHGGVVNQFRENFTVKFRATFLRSFFTVPWKGSVFHFSFHLSFWIHTVWKVSTLKKSFPFCSKVEQGREG